MKLNFSTVPKVVTISALVALLTLGTYFTVQYFINHHEVKTADKTLVAAAKKDFKVAGKTVTDSAGKKHFVTPAGQNVFKQSVIKNNPGALTGTGVDSSAKQAGVKPTDITDWQQVALQLQADNLKAKQTIDSLGNVIESYEDKWLKITFSNGEFSYRESLDLTTATYFKKKFLWIKYGAVTDISTDNPHVTIGGYKTYSVVPDPSPWALRLQAKGTYDFGSRLFIPSANAIVNFGKWEISGGAYYDYFDTKNMGIKATVSGAYNFINIK